MAYLLKLKATFVLLFSILLGYAQSNVTPYSIEITNGEYASFDGTHTRINIFIDNGKTELFKELLPETSLDIVEKESGKSLSEKAGAIKKAYREESARLLKKGVYRSNPNMKEGTPNIDIDDEGNAEDTTGFVISLYTVATPSKGCKSLHIKGEVVYQEFEEDSKDFELTVDDISSLVGPDNYMLTEAGDTLRFEKYEYEGEPANYSASLSGHRVKTIGLNGELERYNQITLTEPEAAKSQMIRFQVIPIKTKTIAVDEEVMLGVGY